MLRRLELASYSETNIIHPSLALSYLETTVTVSLGRIERYKCAISEHAQQRVPQNKYMVFLSFPP